MVKLTRQLSCSNLLQQSCIEKKVHLHEAFNELIDSIPQLAINRRVVEFFRIRSPGFDTL